MKKILIILFPIINTFSAVYYCHNVTQTTLDSAYQLTSAGDSIIVDTPDTATWTSALLMRHGVYLISTPGRDSVRIESNITTYIDTGVICYWPSNYSLNTPCRIHGFTIDGNGNSNCIRIMSFSTTINNKIRVDSNRIIYPGGTNAGRAFKTTGAMYGVFDNNIVDLSSGGMGFTNYGDASGESGLAEWGAFDQIYADSNIMYYEDNYITGPDTWIDGGHGGRYVIRYNTFVNSGTANIFPCIDYHGNQAAGAACMLGEVYGNLFSMNSKAGGIVDQRGGHVLIFYNLAINSVGTMSFKCREEFNDSTYPSANTFVQHVDTSYYWINFYNTSTSMSFSVDGTYSYDGLPNVPTANREFWNYTASFDGTTGMGAGALGSRPATCTVGVGYWATDQSTSSISNYCGQSPTTPLSGTLYICKTTNNWSEYYIPYTYPHPLRSDQGGGGEPSGKKYINATFSGERR